MHMMEKGIRGAMDDDTVITRSVSIRKLQEDVKRDGAGLSRSLSCGPAAEPREHACFRDDTSSVAAARRPIARGFGKVPVRPQPILSG